jgi:hypothetical protein
MIMGNRMPEGFWEDEGEIEDPVRANLQIARKVADRSEAPMYALIAIAEALRDIRDGIKRR